MFADAWPHHRRHGVDGALWQHLSEAAGSIRAALCALRGHDRVLHIERGRMCLRCANCGRETRGWLMK